ncbi:MAG TPA: hypothetical protein PLI57_00110 [Spirochaetota bacterium]|nr:hypothetical protein [Spirochaetota bacterium]
MMQKINRRICVNLFVGEQRGVCSSICVNLKEPSQKLLPKKPTGY